MIALSDQDDVWRNDKLQLIEDAFNKTPKAGLVFSDAEIVDENLKPLDRRMWDEVGFDAHKKKTRPTGPRTRSADNRLDRHRRYNGVSGPNS